MGVPLRQQIGRQDDGDRAAQARPADEQALAQGEVASYRADEDGERTRHEHQKRGDQE